MTEQGRGIRDQGSGTDRAGVPAEPDALDPVLDDLLASLVTPATPVDLRASVLRRIEGERDSRAAVSGWPWTWRSATLAAAAAVLVIATAMVLWRGSIPPSSQSVVHSGEPTPSTAAPQAGPAIRAEGAPREVGAEMTPAARVERPAPMRSVSAPRRASPADTAAADVAAAVPPLAALAPLQLPEMTTDLLTPDALEIERLQVPPPIEIAPLDIDRARNPQR